MEPYENITLAMPGRHAEDTTPKGGDFVVMVTDVFLGWHKHQFTHDDIFRDIEIRHADYDALGFMRDYLGLIAHDKDTRECVYWSIPTGCLDTMTFFCAVQCLAVAEHRRYAKHEPKFGGRFLPFRFAAGIAEGLWTADDAIEKQKYGRPAVERLEKKKGVPLLTQELMK